MRRLVLPRFPEELQVRDRIAVDQEEIREGARLDDAELPRVGVARAGQRQELDVVVGDELQDLRGRHPLPQLEDVGGLVLVVGRGEQEVGAPRELERRGAARGRCT
jgi:hypothetical protein